MKWLIGMGLVLGLAGCGANVPVNVTYDLENGYGIVQSAAVAYAKLPYCKSAATKLCKKPEIVIKLADYDVKARASLKALENYVRDSQNINKVTLSSLVNAANAAILALTEFESSNGIK